MASVTSSPFDENAGVFFGLGTRSDVSAPFFDLTAGSIVPPGGGEPFLPSFQEAARELFLLRCIIIAANLSAVLPVDAPFPRAMFVLAGCCLLPSSTRLFKDEDEAAKKKNSAALKRL
jgi:hypothetical protein